MSFRLVRKSVTVLILDCFSFRAWKSDDRVPDKPNN